jgi:deoxyribonuclease V
MSAVEFSFNKARKAQATIAQKVICEDRFQGEIKLVGGVDVAYHQDWAVGAAAVLDYENLKVVETQTSIQKVKFPYVPTLFAFREFPAAAASIRKLKVQPDVFLVDGHGKAHPYECGLACHLGVALNKPTIGVAKTKLVGEPKRVSGDIFLSHEGEVVGALVTTLAGANPVFVSVGHMMSLQTAVKIVEHCSRQTRIPQPIREAHRMAAEERKAKIGLLH